MARRTGTDAEPYGGAVGGVGAGFQAPFGDRDGRVGELPERGLHRVGGDAHAGCLGGNDPQPLPSGLSGYKIGDLPLSFRTIVPVSCDARLGDPFSGGSRWTATLLSPSEGPRRGRFTARRGFFGLQPPDGSEDLFPPDHRRCRQVRRPAGASIRGRPRGRHGQGFRQYRRAVCRSQRIPPRTYGRYAPFSTPSSAPPALRRRCHNASIPVRGLRRLARRKTSLGDRPLRTHSLDPAQEG